MKRNIRFTAGCVEHLDIGALRIDSMEGIERGCGHLLTAKNGVTIKSKGDPDYNSHCKGLWVHGTNITADSRVIYFGDKNEWETAIDALNEFNEIQKKNDVPEEWSGHEVMPVRRKFGRLVFFRDDVDISTAPSYQRFQGYLYRSSDGQYRHRWSIVNIPGAELVGVLWAKADGEIAK